MLCQRDGSPTLAWNYNRNLQLPGELPDYLEYLKMLILITCSGTLVQLSLAGLCTAVLCKPQTLIPGAFQFGVSSFLPASLLLGFGSSLSLLAG